MVGSTTVGGTAVDSDVERGGVVLGAARVDAAGIVAFGLALPACTDQVVQPILASCQGDGGWFSEGSLDGERKGDVCGKKVYGCHCLWRIQIGDSVHRKGDGELSNAHHENLKLFPGGVCLRATSVVARRGQEGLDF